MKTCDAHSGFEARLNTLEESNREHAKELKALRITISKWGGAILAVPFLLKFFEWFVSIAQAATHEKGREIMEGIVDPSLMTSLVEAIGLKQWSILVGIILLMLVATVRKVTKDRLSEQVAKAVSVVSALVAGIGAALIAGMPWWNALLVGLFVAPSSSGFWELIGKLIPRRSGTSALLLLLILPVQIGCAGQPWLTARGIVDGASAAIDSIEVIVPEDAEGRDQAFQITRDALDMGSLAVGIWERERGPNPPTGWQEWISEALEGISGILQIAKSSGAAIPPEVLGSISALSSLMSLFGS